MEVVRVGGGPGRPNPCRVSTLACRERPSAQKLGEDKHRGRGHQEELVRDSGLGLGLRWMRPGTIELEYESRANQQRCGHARSSLNVVLIIAPIGSPHRREHPLEGDYVSHRHLVAE